MFQTLSNLPQPPSSYYCWQLKLFIESANTNICRKENSNDRSKLIPLLFATSIEMTCDSVIQNWEKGNWISVWWVNKFSRYHKLLLVYQLDEGVSIKTCWDTLNVQDSKIELIKSAYCTFLDVPHKSKVPDTGKIYPKL